MNAAIRRLCRGNARGHFPNQFILRGRFSGTSLKNLAQGELTPNLCRHDAYTERWRSAPTIKLLTDIHWLRSRVVMTWRSLHRSTNGTNHDSLNQTLKKRNFHETLTTRNPQGCLEPPPQKHHKKHSTTPFACTHGPMRTKIRTPVPIPK